MSWPALIVVTLVLVLVFGLVSFKLLRKNRDVVPDLADRHAARQDRAVAVDDAGQPIMESQVGDETGPRDDDAFEDVLKDQLDDLRS
jgi:hypothetical protein